MLPVHRRRRVCRTFIYDATRLYFRAVPTLYGYSISDFMDRVPKLGTVLPCGRIFRTGGYINFRNLCPIARFALNY